MIPLPKPPAELTLAARQIVEAAGYDRPPADRVFGFERDDEYFATWKRELVNLAEAPNVVIKISGLGMGDNEWTVDSIRPWVMTCIETFGVERSFFGSNWPVDRLYSSYGDVVNAYAEIISGFSQEEQVALFSGNAERIFRI